MASNERLEDIANRVNLYAKAENKQFGIDPLTIIAILNVTLTLIRLVYQCRQNRTAMQDTIHKPGPMSRFLMRRQIRKHFPLSERKAVYNAMLTVGGKLSYKELDEVLDFVEISEENK
jgi:cell division protein ZapA (FtsZ GTPase activity inhibitor)